MVLTPISIQKALERRLCAYTHQTISGTVPPIEATRGRPVSGYITPPEWAYKWRIFSLIFGELSPAGVSDKFTIVHWGPMVTRHEDPWIHSIVDREYPLLDVLGPGEKHGIEIYNRTGEAQTFDVTVHLVEFRSEKTWNEYRALVEEMKSLLTVSREELEALRKIGRLSP